MGLVACCRVSEYHYDAGSLILSTYFDLTLYDALVSVKASFSYDMGIHSHYLHISQNSFI